MAHVIPSAKPEDPKAYNVGAAVGPLATNAAGDVKLVQYMLKHVYGPPAASLKVDGYIGPTTISWIKRFQEDSKKSGVNVLVDSRVDPARGQVSSISRTVYTVLVLNRALRERNPAAYEAVPKNVPLTPPPPSTPYNPASPKKILMVFLFGYVPPMEAYVCYSDGSVLRMYAKGVIHFDDGTPVYRVPRFTPGGNLY